MTLITLRLTPAHRRIFLDQHFGEAMYVAPGPPVVTRPGPDTYFWRGIRVALCLDALLVLCIVALFLIARRWIGA